jgi:hypothetical protein
MVLLKRLILAGALVGMTLALSLPHARADRIIFVVSGGGLKHPISFSSERIGPAHGWWWEQRSRVPQLVGPQFRMRFYDTRSASSVTEWTYVPQASGALAVVGDASGGGKRTVWMAFTPAFNADFFEQVDGSFDHVDSHALLVLLTIAIVVLLLMTATGLGLDALPLWLVRFVRRDVSVVVSPDLGPAYLYTSVPRAQWPDLGRLGYVPETRASSH